MGLGSRNWGIGNPCWGARPEVQDPGRWRQGSLRGRGQPPCSVAAGMPRRRRVAYRGGVAAARSMPVHGGWCACSTPDHVATVPNRHGCSTLRKSSSRMACPTLAYARCGCAGLPQTDATVSPWSCCSCPTSWCDDRSVKRSRPSCTGGGAGRGGWLLAAPLAAAAAGRLGEQRRGSGPCCASDSPLRQIGAAHRPPRSTQRYRSASPTVCMLPWSIGSNLQRSNHRLLGKFGEL